VVAVATLCVVSPPELFALSPRRLADAADAEDAAQETFLRAYDHLDRYDPTRPFATWLFAIGKNVAANHAIARTRREARDAAPPTAIADTAAGDVWKRAPAGLRPGAHPAHWARSTQG